jgi:SAM-dependent methyltransferase
MSTAKRVSPSAARNLAPIVEVLASRLPREGLVLEIASGTGQHIAAFARRFSQLAFQPSDPDPAARASIEAWRAEAGAANLLPPLNIDVKEEGWWKAVDGPVAAIVAINLVHISPWAATEGLFAGAGRLVGENGLVYHYGPYKRDGAHTAPSNEAFDASLRRSDPTWGLRDIADVADIAAANGLLLEEIVPMPTNNFSLVLRRAGGQAALAPKAASRRSR